MLKMLKKRRRRPQVHMLQKILREVKIRKRSPLL
jgi:hypothetical protein